ncbi:MAG: phage major capsid protein, partial [Smithella sp.]
MALTLTELEATTKDYFLADNRKAIDIYFNDSFYMDYSMNKKKAILKRYSGGKKIKCHLNYDGQEGGFYDKNSTLSSDDKETLNAAFFTTKHCYGNATIHRNDELENAGEYAEVELAVNKLEGAQKTCRKKIAQQIYANNGDGAQEITGIKAMCFGAAATKYGDIAENDLVAADGTKPWKAVNTTGAAAISLSAIRTLRSSAK